jgi:hypothetical protein
MGGCSLSYPEFVGGRQPRSSSSDMARPTFPPIVSTTFEVGRTRVREPSTSAGHSLSGSLSIPRAPTIFNFLGIYFLAWQAFRAFSTSDEPPIVFPPQSSPVGQDPRNRQDRQLSVFSHKHQMACTLQNLDEYNSSIRGPIPDRF